MRFIVAIEPGTETTAFGVLIPDLPGCFSAGDTLDEALDNAREEEARHNRFLLTPEDYLKAEMKAMELGVDLIGVFHSHPDCPNVPSEYDREWAQPFFSYIISRVDAGKAVSHRSWRLQEDRSKYDEEEIEIQ